MVKYETENLIFASWQLPCITLSGRGRKLGVLGKLGTSENQLSEVFNSEFSFCTFPKTENSEMKTSECSFKPFYQTSSFSNSEFSILHYTQNGKLGVGNLGVFSKVCQNSDFLKLLNQTPRFSNSEFSILHYTQNGKLKTSEFDQTALEKTPRFSSPSFPF